MKLRATLPAALLALTMLALSVAAAPSPAAAASGDADPREAAPGTRIHFTAAGFQPGERVDFWATPPSGPTRPRYPSVQADGRGAVLWSWDVAAGDPSGGWTMSARGIRSDLVLAIPFAVVGSRPAPERITVAPAGGGPGTTFAFTAADLTPSSRVGAFLIAPDGATRDLVPGEGPGLVADRDGRLAWSWTAPADVRGGAWQMVARDIASARELVVGFSVAGAAPATPDRSVAPAAGAPGTTFVVTVGGFEPGEQVGSWLTAPRGASVDGVPYMRADAAGRVQWRWPSPAGAESGRWLAVTRGEASAREVAIPLTVGGSNPAPAGPPPPAGVVAPASGAGGDTFTFSISGFAGGEQVGYWATRPDGSVEETPRKPVTASPTGGVVVTWQAPARPQGGQWSMTFRGLRTRREERVSFAVAAAAQAGSAVSPPAAGPGTAFTFTVGGLRGGEAIETWLEAPDGRRVDSPSDARADARGVATWGWTAPGDALGGAWTAVTRGRDSGRVERLSLTVVGGAAPMAPAEVTPARGAAGTTFRFRATGYKEGERVGYWLNLPDGTIVAFERDLRADDDGVVTWSYTVPPGAQRGLYMMAARSSQNDEIVNDVSYTLRFVVE